MALPRVVLAGGKLSHGDVLPYQASRYWRVRIASSDAQHQVVTVGTSYIVWTKIKGV